MKEQDETTRQFSAQGLRDPPHEFGRAALHARDVARRQGESPRMDGQVARGKRPAPVQAGKWRRTGEGRRRGLIGRLT